MLVGTFIGRALEQRSEHMLVETLIGRPLKKARKEMKLTNNKLKAKDRKGCR